MTDHTMTAEEYVELVASPFPRTGPDAVPLRFDPALAAPLLDRLRGFKARADRGRELFEAGELKARGQGHARAASVEYAARDLTPDERDALERLHVMLLPTVTGCQARRFHAYAESHRGAAAGSFELVDLLAESWRYVLTAVATYDAERGTQLHSWTHTVASSLALDYCKKTYRRYPVQAGAETIDDDEDERPYEAPPPNYDRFEADAYRFAGRDGQLRALCRRLFEPDPAAGAPDA